MLKSFFEPKSVALIGASRHEGKVGHIIAKNLLKFKKIYFVNPSAEEILGKKCFSSILDIPEKIELAVIVVKAELALRILQECARKGIKSAIIISSGFSEVGRKGKKLENKILNFAKKSKIRILGPNCFGIINPYLSINTTFSSINVLKGDTAFISQSGALGSGILDMALQKKIAFSKLIFLGNEADIDFNDVLSYLAEDSKTKKILLYIEGLKLGVGRNFIDAARKCLKNRKRIIAIKAGITEPGRKLVLTHTAALAGEAEIYKAAFEQAGIILAKNLTSALEIIKGEKIKKIKKIRVKKNKKIKKQKKIIAVSNAGGAAVLLTDYFSERGLEFMPLSPDLIKKLNKILPKAWNRTNPIDIVGDADAQRYKEVLDILSKEKFDSLICILTPQAMSQPLQVAQELVNFKNKTGKQVIGCFIGAVSVKDASEFLKKNKILSFSELEDCAEFIEN